jgi:tRNA modification GTPase
MIGNDLVALRQHGHRKTSAQKTDIKVTMSETIYALASAPGIAGVAVLRLSGPRTRACLEQLCSPLPAPRVASLRNISAIDNGLVLWFPSPHSYTGEDMAEFQVHGGRAVLAALSEALARCGARLAAPGEFTRRAVMNGKLDLTEAEAVADIVDAQTQAQRRQALRQLGGELRALYDGWRVRLTKAEAHLTAAIDFADDDLPPALIEDVCAQLRALQQEISLHLQDSHRGEKLRSGISAVIIGAPNAGKSSLLNRLAARDVAIVTPIAGTTRDVLEVELELGGYPLAIADTAGLRAAVDVVEQEGVRRALARSQQADFRLLVFDATTNLPPDVETLAQYQPGDLLIINKADLQEAEALRAALGDQALVISALTGAGFDALLGRLQDKLEALAGISEAPTLTRARHREALEEAAADLTRALQAAQLDLQAEDVRRASRALGRITGHVGIEELLDVIFRDFCLGK